jgi:hypothetical protein
VSPGLFCFPLPLRGFIETHAYLRIAMPKTPRRSLFLAPIAIGLVFVAGCSTRTISVSGTAVFPDSVKLNATDVVQIAFYPEDKDAKQAPGAVFSGGDNSFVCKNVLPGAKYKIGLRIDPGMGSPDAQKRAAAFEALNKAFDRTTTKLTFQAAEDSSQSLALDFVKGTVTVTKK